jgi:hypothetical protein
MSVVDEAVAVLEALPTSPLRKAYRQIESDAQEVWRRRMTLRASDLVRFSRTSVTWRNSQVEIRGADVKAALQLQAVVNPMTAHDLASAAGTREVASASVVGTNPIRLCVASRWPPNSYKVVALHVNGQSCVEVPIVDVVVNASNVKFRNMSLGSLVADEQTAIDGSLRWDCKVKPSVNVGDQIVLACTAWFQEFRSGHEIAVVRPSQDKKNAPSVTCTPASYVVDPVGHQWCCRPHDSIAAELADRRAQQRAKGELNPDVWPPLVDEDRFDAPAKDDPTDLSVVVPELPVAADLTIDDLD